MATAAGCRQLRGSDAYLHLLPSNRTSDTGGEGMIELVGVLAVFLGGLAVGYISAQWRSADVVERFRNVDGKFYERGKAFREIEERNRLS